MKPLDFSHAIITWQAQHGRHDLPWQTKDPYGVWLSEIMLQQTQVQTVRAYYTRFLQRFPTVQALAAASLDEVMGLWSGLGYYTRARNIHLAAQQIVQQWQGQFPRTAQTLETLPGIGPSTAAAIASFCYGERVAIMDGNVKRVLTRYLGFTADLSNAAAVRQLWALASDLLPTAQLAKRMPLYTQGLMDLGAMVCHRKQPACDQCPVQAHCQAHEQGLQHRYPVKTRKLKRHTQRYLALFRVDQLGAVWLEQRPSSGIWGGLYAPPLLPTEQDLLAHLQVDSLAHLRVDPPIKHVLTHVDLWLQPVWLRGGTQNMDNARGRWLAPDECFQLGLPAPIRQLLHTL